MFKKVIVRRDGSYIQTLSNDYTAVRNWFRTNSPNPKYTEFAKNFTLEIVGIEEDVPAVVNPTKINAISFEEYRHKFAPREEIYA